jgi:hypothetical protein
MTTRVSGTFEVKLAPLDADEKSAEVMLGRMSIDKQFHGGLEATSRSEMLMAGASVNRSAGYVALERVTGTLSGRHGGFTRQHSATMNRGVPELSVTVIPDSGSEQLLGIAGRMTIQIADGKHSYEFEFSLPGN